MKLLYDFNLAPKQSDKPSTTPEDPITAFRKLLPELGGSLPIADGKIHRYGEKNHLWYVLFSGEIYAGAYGSWRTGESATWCQKSEIDMTPSEIYRYRVHQDQIRAQRDKDQADQYARSAAKAQIEWSKSTEVKNHPYLEKKCIEAHGVRLFNGKLIIPLTKGEQIVSLQKIDANGEKRFLVGGEVKGASYTISGSGPSSSTVAIVEGFATGATVAEATGWTVICVMSAGNMSVVAKDRTIHYICADNDEAGRKAAEATAAICGAEIKYPPEGKDFNDIGIDLTRAMLCNTVPGLWDNPLNLPSLINVVPFPVKWFIKDRLIAGRGAVCSGIGGSSKTRLLFHLAVGVAIGRLSWDWEMISRGRSILVMTEDTAEDFHRIIHNLCEALDLSMEEKTVVYNSVIPYPLAGEDTILLQKTGKNTLIDSPLLVSLIDKIKSEKNIVFVGLDPALSLTDGDELDQGHQRKLGKMADNIAVNTGATVMLIAHAPKNPKEEIASHNSRGGGALVDAVRTEFVMRTMTTKEAGKYGIIDPAEKFRHVQLVATKGNFLPPEAYLSIWLRRDNFGMLHGVQLEDTKNIGLNDTDTDALAVLVELNGAKFGDWMNELVNRGIISAGSIDSQKKAMQRIKEKLMNLNIIFSIKRGFWQPKNPLDFNNV